MSLERKDVRAKLNPDVHAALCALCEIDSTEIGAFIESVLVAVITKRIKDANLTVEKTRHLTISGNGGE